MADITCSLQSMNETVFSCRVVDIDSHLTTPINGFDATYSDFSGQSIKKVPIIRIFGATPSGQKACVHIHGTYPYLYVPCPIDYPTTSYLKQFGRSIDHALQMSFSGVGMKDESHIYELTLINGLPFYGYHSSEEVFIKIQLYNPSHIKGLAELLLAGAIMSVPLQPHESHIPFVLQFMIDNNLYGMNYMHSSKVVFRKGEMRQNALHTAQLVQTVSIIPFDIDISFTSTDTSPSLSSHQTVVWNTDTLPVDMILYEAKTSTCELEVDINVQDILNRQHLNNSGEFPGLISLWEEEQRRREILNIDNHLSPPPSPDRTECPLIHEAEEKHRTILFDIINKRCSISPLLHDTPTVTPPTEEEDQSLLAVDKDAIDNSMKLSRKLSSVSFNSSEAELVDVLVDLMGSPSDLNQTLISTIQPLSQPLISQTLNQSLSQQSLSSNQLLSQPLISQPLISTEGDSINSETDLFHDISLNDNETGISVLSQLLTQSDFTRNINTLSQINLTSTQLSYHDRKKLVQLCMSSGDEEEEERKEDEDEDMSQPIDSGDSRTLETCIPQLDGSHSQNKKKHIQLSRRRSKIQTNTITNQPQPRLIPEPSQSGLIPEPSQSGLIPEPSQSELTPKPSQSGLTLKPSQSVLIPKPSQSGLIPESSVQSRIELRHETPEIDKRMNVRKRKRSHDDRCSSEYSDTSISTPPSVLATRALNSSLFPKIPKLSREDSEKYLAAMKEQRQATPFTKTTLEAQPKNSSTKRLNKSSSKSKRSLEFTGKITKSSTRRSSRKSTTISSKHTTASINKSLRARPFFSYDVTKINKAENDMISQAIAESLKTLRMEKKRLSSNMQESEGNETNSKNDECQEEPSNNPVLSRDSVSEESCNSQIEYQEKSKNDHVLSDDSLLIKEPFSNDYMTDKQIEYQEKSTNDPLRSHSFILGEPSSSHFVTDKHKESTSSPKLSHSFIIGETYDVTNRQIDYREEVLSQSLLIEEPCISSDDDDSECSSSLIKHNNSDDNNSEFQLILSSESELEDEPQTATLIKTTPSPTPIDYCIDETVSWKPQYNIDKCIIKPQVDPPLIKDTTSIRHLKPFYSNPVDKQPPQEYGGKKVYVPSHMPYELPEFDHNDRQWCTLEHWQTVMAIHNDETSFPLPCYPKKGNKETYTAQKHQEDIISRSKFWPTGSCIISPLTSAPDPLLIKEQLKSQSTKLQTPSDDYSHLEGPSLDNTYGFQFTPTSTTDASTELQVQYITQMSVELHIRTRDRLRPDPKYDPVLALFYYIHNDWPSSVVNNEARDSSNNDIKGIIAIDLSNNSIQCTPTKNKSPIKNSPTKLTPQKYKESPQKYKGSPQKYKESPQKYKGSPQKYKESPQKYKESPQKYKGSPQKYKESPQKYKGHPSHNILVSNVLNAEENKEEEEEEIASSTDTNISRPYLEYSGLSSTNIKYVNSEGELYSELIQLVRRHDPDILLGYEMQKGSWGYLKSRSSYLGVNLIGQIGRVPTVTNRKHSLESGSGSEVSIQGRIVLNVWRILKHEVSLTRYTYENLSYHVLHSRVPKFSFQTLTEWYEYRNRLYRSRVVDYYMSRCHGNCQLLEKFNLIGRTSEMARLYGIEFYNVLARGSQYRVESMMLRLAKQFNYIAVSPSVQQRARMAAPECLQLIMEPESKFYSDPVLVLDFQSLYPSMVIAYNYCYSTCLGRVKHLANDGDYVFGACSLNISRQHLKQLKDHVTISPNGIVFVKPELRRGVLPQMLEKILNTRIMVKQSMKLHKQNKVLQRLLDARQLGLKLIANVTYGYTNANFSGRMPCVEIADSIVRKGRETLERAIELVNTTLKWRGRVVYGDTDSMFVLLKGVTKEEAFRIGNEISEAVTATNPKPVKLKFEKVYLPCILQTKKRYAGYSYESPDQVEPIFDAKGIETVRRDGCPAATKVLEKSLKLLFSTKDISLVKSYVQRQCCKILDGKISLEDYVFAKEYRGRRGYRPGACVPALELAKKMVAIDRQSEPLSGERVPYVIIYDSPGLPLIQLVRGLDEVAFNPSLHINANYYITKQIMPPLDRSLSLLGVNVFQWYTELPRTQRPTTSLTTTHTNKIGTTISQYFTSLHCPICETITCTATGICEECSKRPHQVAVTLSSHIQRAESKYLSLCQLCQNCCGNRSSEYYLKCVSLDCPVFHSRQTSLQRLSNVCSHKVTLDNFIKRYSLN